MARLRSTALYQNLLLLRENIYMENGPFGEDKTIKLFVSKNQQRKNKMLFGLELLLKLRFLRYSNMFFMT